MPTSTRKTMRHVWMLAALTGALLAGCAAAPNDAPAEQGVFFIAPADNSTVDSPFKTEFGVKGMAVQVAGAVVPNQGHFHLLLDVPFQPKGELIPADANHLHFGKGQSEALVTLPPGKHTLTLQFGDGAHISYGKEMSATLTVNVR